MAKKKKTDQGAEGNGSAENGSKKTFKIPAFGIMGTVCALIFFPTTIVLVVGMIPTIVAYLADGSKKKSKSITVGAMNLAGCTPFLLKLWLQDHSFEMALDVIGSPRTIIVMYSMAGVGYLLDWALTGIISTMLYQKGILRREQIERRQMDLIEKWDKKVTGEIPLDERGFPIVN